MKKSMLFLAGMLLIAISATYAQVDTTSNRSAQAGKAADATTNDPGQNYTKDMIKIQQSELPNNFHQTFQDTRYKGWESGTFYRSKAGDAYLLEMKAGDRTTIHRFDANGLPIKE